MFNLLQKVGWSRLYFFSQSQLVSIGIFAVTLVPIAAQLIVFWYSLNLPAEGGGTKIDAIRFLATDLYIGGLVMLAGKLIVSLACPERIQRFPFREDFVIYSADARRAQERLGDKPSSLEDRVMKRAEDAPAHQKSWNDANMSLPRTRGLIAALFIAGTCCVGSFLLYRLFYNTAKTTAMWGI